MSDKKERALVAIEKEMKEVVKKFEKEGKLLEAERIKRRTLNDLAMIRAMGYCSGIENYSAHFESRPSGISPFCLFDFFPKDFLCIIDESHVALPQLRGMHAGDRSRKKTLIDFGFRLPSAYDNRPLQFSEIEKHLNDVRDLAKIWHSSKEGKTWHKLHGKQSWLHKRIFIRKPLC